MKKLNQKAAAILRKLVSIAEATNGHAKIDTNGYDPETGGIMPVVVESRPALSYLGSHVPCWSVAHYYQQNGDLMSDPFMEFLIFPNGDCYAITFQMDGILARYDEVLIFDQEGDAVKCVPRLSRELGLFANQWMLNINAQQDLKSFTRQLNQQSTV